MKTNSTRHMSAIVLAGAAMILSVPAVANAAERAVPRGNAEATTNSARTTGARGETRYCIKETPTGSHITDKICKTRSEWMDQGFDPLAKK